MCQFESDWRYKVMYHFQRNNKTVVLEKLDGGYNGYKNHTYSNGDIVVDHFVYFLPLDGDQNRDKIAFIHAENKPAKYWIYYRKPIRVCVWCVFSSIYFKVNHENI